jgi:hypothetical protein
MSAKEKPRTAVPTTEQGLERLTTDKLMEMLGSVGSECKALDKALKERRAARLRLMLALHERGVAKRALGRTAQISDVAVIGALERHAARTAPA